jgi:hypothetical protein
MHRLSVRREETENLLSSRVMNEHKGCVKDPSKC